METPVIRYNLKDRGRQHTGQKRNFNIRAIADAINSPATQETVAARGMLGYYGHAPRIRFGLAPVEGGFEQGKYKVVQPAIVTTHLRADYDGNVEHRAEFLDTEDGALAAKLWGSKVGGFSSAIDEGKPAFYGFDYVAQPNFLGNSFRGAALDGVGQGAGDIVTYDSIYAVEQVELATGHAMAALLDSIHVERGAANAVIERLQLENEQLISALVSAGRNPSAVLDDVGGIRPALIDRDRADRLLRDRAFFHESPLPAMAALPDKGKLAAPDYAEQRLLNRWG